MNTNKSLRELGEEFGDWFGEPKLPRIDYVHYVAQVNLDALTPQELEWLKQAQQEDAR